MKAYKIIFAEFSKYIGENEYKISCTGDIPGISKTKLDTSKSLIREKEFIINKPFYKNIKILEINENEFKIKTTLKNSRRIDIHHYKIVEFSI